MRRRAKILCSAAIASTLALTSCTSGYFTAPVYLSVTVSPRPAAIPAGTSVVFTAAVSNNLSLPVWSILDAANANNPGTLTAVSTPANSIQYTAPASPPIYTFVTPTFITQGTVTLQVSATAPPQSNLPVAHDSISVYITTPTVAVNLTPTTANVAFNATQQFIGYAVGNVNNALTWQVNGVSGGTAATGTITSGGTYTAPASLPITGNPVTITMVSQADPTKTASALVTLQ
jgi:hypothetical protein